MRVYMEHHDGGDMQSVLDRVIRAETHLYIWAAMQMAKEIVPSTWNRASDLNMPSHWLTKPVTINNVLFDVKKKYIEVGSEELR